MYGYYKTEGGADTFTSFGGFPTIDIDNMLVDTTTVSSGTPVTITETGYMVCWSNNIYGMSTLALDGQTVVGFFGSISGTTVTHQIFYTIPVRKGQVMTVSYASWGYRIFGVKWV